MINVGHKCGLLLGNNETMQSFNVVFVFENTVAFSLHVKTWFVSQEVVFACLRGVERFEFSFTELKLFSSPN